MEDGDEEENENDNYRSMFPDTEMEDNEQQQEEEDEERAPDEPADDLGRIISDARLGCNIGEVAIRADVTGPQQIVVPNL